MTRVIDMRIHQQNVDGFCGAACAQMAFASLGKDVSQLHQIDLYTDSHTFSASGAIGWHSFPDSLVDVLNAQWQDNLGLRFRLFRCADREGLLRTVRRTIEDHYPLRAVPIVLTGASDHWVVVRGFETKPAPVAGEPDPVVGLHLRNPLPSRGSDEQDKHDVHGSDDDCCENALMCSFCHYVNITYWNAKMLLGVQDQGPWQGEFLAICPHPMAAAGADVVEVPPTAVNGGDGVQQPGGANMSTDEIAANVDSQIARNPLEDIECLSSALRGATPGTPIFVQGLTDDGTDDENEAYYIVPFTREGRVPLLVTFDAVTGEFQEAIATPEGTIYDASWIDVEGNNDRASTNGEIRLRQREEQDSEFPFRLVWRPTYQSPTRFWPLFEGDRPRGDGTDELVYMRIDGEVFTELERLHA